MENVRTNKLKCPLCLNTKFHYLFQAKDYISLDPFVVYRCTNCGLVITEVGSVNGGISDYYNKGYYGQRKFLVNGIINHARVKAILKFGNFMPSSSILDVGCGNGTFLICMRNLGWRSFGTEIAPSDHLEKNISDFIRMGDFKDIALSEGLFDVVTMWHSLEHVKDPLGYLIEAKRVLKPGGILVIEIPNFQSLQARIFKQNWFHLDVPRHLLHFSPKSINGFFERAGFEKVKIKKSSLVYGFFGYLQSILNILSVRKNLFFDFINSKVSLCELYKNHKKDFFVNFIFLVPALIVSVILFSIELIIGRSGIILVSGRKQI